MTCRRNFSNTLNSLGLWIILIDRQTSGLFLLYTTIQTNSWCRHAEWRSTKRGRGDNASADLSKYSHSSEEDPQIRIPAVSGYHQLLKAALIYSTVVIETAKLLSVVEFAFAQLYGSSLPVHWKPSCSESRTGSVVLSVLWGLYFG